MCRAAAQQLRAARGAAERRRLQSPQLLMLSGIGPGSTCSAASPCCWTCPAWARTCTTTPTWCRWSCPAQSELFGMSLPGVARIVRDVQRWRRERRGR
jgi:hypothetical protein